MHQHALVIERDDAVGLVAVGEEGSRHGAPDDQRQHRMAGQPRLGIGSDSAGQRLVDAERFFAPAVGLAGRIDDRHDGALDRQFAVCFDRFAHRARQRPAFEQTGLAMTCPREAAVGVRHQCDPANRGPRQFAVGNPH
ncbi:hypothetical protein D9M72_368610 [compost metagenome]